MKKAVNAQIMRTITLLITTVSLSLPAYARYSGGTGDPNDPYQIATADDLMLLGENPDEYDKHFILTADIDLDPNLPGRKVFDNALIASDINDTENDFQGTPFTGVFNGNDYTISNLTITGANYLGLFGQLASTASVSNLGLESVYVSGTGDCVGGLVSVNLGSIITSYSSGIIAGNNFVGGLAGRNDGNITTSYSAGTVTGETCVGGLTGISTSDIIASYSSGTVTGDSCVGGLVGRITARYREIETTYSGVYLLEYVSTASIATSYSNATVTGNSDVGGLVGCNKDDIFSRSLSGVISTSFWDIATSGQATSAGGTGLTTAEMQDIDTFLNAGWDFVGEVINGTCDYWKISPAEYPKLHYCSNNNPIMPEGLGTVEQPYLIRDARDMGTVWFEPMAHYRLEESIELSGITWSAAIIPWFGGTFDGNGCIITNLHIQGSGNLGLFGRLCSTAIVSNLGLESVDVSGTGWYAGGLVGNNSGSITTCYSSGTITGINDIGGLVGFNNYGSIDTSYSIGQITGSNWAGGLVGCNYGSITTSYSNSSVNGDSDVGGFTGWNNGSIATSYSKGTVTGNNKTGGQLGSNYGSLTACHSSCIISGSQDVGGLVGYNSGGLSENTIIADCYSTGTVSGINAVGGLVGDNYGNIITSYSTGKVAGESSVGGLVGLGFDFNGTVLYCVWDMQTSDIAGSAGGVGLSTVEMKDPYILGLNGFANDPNWILDPGSDYPKLAWEDTPGSMIPEPDIEWLKGQGTTEDPYRIDTAHQLIRLGKASILCDDNFILDADIDLEPNLPVGQVFAQAVIPTFNGILDGKGHKISNLTIAGTGYLGFFGQLGSTASVSNLGLESVDVNGIGDCVGGLVSVNLGSIITCYSNGTISGENSVGGIAGRNDGSIINTYSTGLVSGNSCIGGLVGLNGSLNRSRASINTCYSSTAVSGSSHIGGLVGDNGPAGSIISRSSSTGTVKGDQCAGGLVGYNVGGITESYSTSAVTGNEDVGGLAGQNVYLDNVVGPNGLTFKGWIDMSYSTGLVRGNQDVGGLVGDNGWIGSTTASVWDTETSGQIISDGGTGKTTAEMQTSITFLDVGWDFMGETANGTDDIWWILEGRDYPRLWWEAKGN